MDGRDGDVGAGSRAGAAARIARRDARAWRDWETPSQSWEYRGVNYRFVGDLDHAVLGRDVSGHVVCAESITLYEGAIGGPKRAEYFAAGEAGLFAAP